MARQTSYTEEMEQKALEYLENYADHSHPLPSVVGMAIVIGVAKSTLYKWAEDGHGTMSDTLAYCNDFQHLTLINKGLTNDFNPTIVKLALANHGYSDKQQTELSGPNGGPVEVEHSTFEFVPVGSDA